MITNTGEIFAPNQKEKVMALVKKLYEMSLDEINEELGNIKGQKADYKRIDHARNALKKALEKGKVQYDGEGEFFTAEEEAEALVQAEAEAEAEKSKVKAETAPKVLYVFTDEHPLVGTSRFTRYGHRNIIAVGTVEGSEDAVVGKIIDGAGKERVVSLKTAREKAVNKEYRSRYPVDKEVKTASGKPSIGVADEITDALKGKTIEDLKAIAAENSIEYKWDERNPGMQRMCLGNVLRGNARRGQRVVINGVVICEGAGEPAAPVVRGGDDAEFDGEVSNDQTDDSAEAA